jgi:hypothetical protein
MPLIFNQRVQTTTRVQRRLRTMHRSRFNISRSITLQPSDRIWHQAVPITHSPLTEHPEPRRALDMQLLEEL